MNLKDENEKFERYLDGVIKYGLRHANMKVEHFEMMIKRYKEMEKVIDAARGIQFRDAGVPICVSVYRNEAEKLQQALKEYDEA